MLKKNAKLRLPEHRKDDDYVFSEELKILDDNTVKYMIDQLEEEVKE